MRTIALTAAVLLSFGAQALAREKPQWPVRNPLILKRYTPSTRARVISGTFGPRLKWGSNRYDHHEGWDFYAFFDPKAFPDGHHPVYAVLDGEVAEVIDPPDPERVETGRKVVLLHDADWSDYGAPEDWGKVYTAYLHLTTIEATAGAKVKAGDVVGVAGETGSTSTVHLHFNTYRMADGALINVNPARLYCKDRNWIEKLSKRNTRLQLLDWDATTRQATLRVQVPHTCVSFDGLSLILGEQTREFSFEKVSAEMRDRRDRGDSDLFEGIKLFPLRFNGGEPAARLNDSGLPSKWPARRFAVEGSSPLLGWDIVIEDVPEGVTKLEVTLRGVLGEEMTAKLPLKGDG